MNSAMEEGLRKRVVQKYNPLGSIYLDFKFPIDQDLIELVETIYMYIPCYQLEMRVH